MKKILKKLVAPIFTALVLFLKLFKKIVVVRTFLGNQSLFGHLSLEPEKYLISIDTGSELSEIGFVGEKLPKNIRSIYFSKPKSKLTIDLWTFGNRSSHSNKALVKMWKRKLHVVPSQIMDLVLKANSKFSNAPIIDYRFSTLLSADKYLDDTTPHLSFNSKEIERGIVLLDKLGIPVGSPYICVVTRESNDNESSLRNKDINDLSELIHALVVRGLYVVRLGSPNMQPLNFLSDKVIDYARSVHKSPEGDIYLVANCHFMVSTMTGPDALALAFRKNVLLVDISHYGLFFSGTKLVTWIPAKLSDGQKYLSLDAVFKCGAGWFWKDSQFQEIGISVVKSSPSEIAEYGIEFLEKLSNQNLLGPSDLQRMAQLSFDNAMGELGRDWHGRSKAFISNIFLEKNSDWFIS